MCGVLLLPGAVGRGLVSTPGVVPHPPSGQPWGNSQTPSLGQAGSQSALISSSVCGRKRGAGGPRDEAAGCDARLHRSLLPQASVRGLWLLHPPLASPFLSLPVQEPCPQQRLHGGWTKIAPAEAIEMSRRSRQSVVTVMTNHCRVPSVVTQGCGTC